MKKFVSVLLAVLLTLGVLCGMSVSAAAQTVTVSSAEAKPGETADITISFENNPGICAVLVSLDFDTTVLSVDKENVEISDSVGGDYEYATKFAWDKNKNVTYSGVFFTLHFTVSQTAAGGEYPIVLTYKKGDISNKDEDDVDFTIVNGKITVQAESSCAHTKTSYGYDETQHWVVCDKCGETVGAKQAHSFGGWVTTAAPTATKDGTQERTCECGYTQSKAISWEDLPQSWERHEENDGMLYFAGSWTRLAFSDERSAFSGYYANRAYSTTASVTFRYEGDSFQLGTYSNLTQGTLWVTVDDDEPFPYSLRQNTAMTSGVFVAAEYGEHTVTVRAGGDGCVWVDYVDVAGSMKPIAAKEEKQALQKTVIEETEFTLDSPAHWSTLQFDRLSGKTAIRSSDIGATASYTFTGSTNLDLVSYKSPTYGSCRVTVTETGSGETVLNEEYDLHNGILKPDQEYQCVICSLENLSADKEYRIVVTVTEVGSRWAALVDALILYQPQA